VQSIDQIARVVAKVACPRIDGVVVEGECFADVKSQEAAYPLF